MSEKLRKKPMIRKTSSVAHFAAGMGAEEFKSLQDKFRSMSGKTGTIDEEQFPKLLESLHIKTTKSEQSILFKEIDLDGDKRITFSEFLKGLKWIKTSNVISHQKRTINRSRSITNFVEQLDEEQIAHVKEIFDFCDEDGDGIVTKGQFYKLIKDLGLEMSKSQFNMLFKNLDVNNDGSIQFEEFLSGMRWLQKGFRVSSENSDGVVDTNVETEKLKDDDVEEDSEIQDLREKNKVLVNFLKELVGSTLDTARAELKNKKLRTADLLLQIVDIDLLLDMEEYVGTILSKQQTSTYKKIKSYLKEMQSNMVKE